jgi:hypothetical protein
MPARFLTHHGAHEIGIDAVRRRVLRDQIVEGGAAGRRRRSARERVGQRTKIEVWHQKTLI